MGGWLSYPLRYPCEWGWARFVRIRFLFIFAHGHTRGEFEQAFEKNVICPSALLCDEENRVVWFSQQGEGVFQASAIDFVEDRGAYGFSEKTFGGAAGQIHVCNDIGGRESEACFPANPFQGATNDGATILQAAGGLSANEALRTEETGRGSDTRIREQSGQCIGRETPRFPEIDFNARKGGYGVFAEDLLIVDTDDDDIGWNAETHLSTDVCNLGGDMVVCGENTTWFREFFQPGGQSFEEDDFVSQRACFDE